jgi:hypothetical protein
MLLLALEKGTGRSGWRLLSELAIAMKPIQVMKLLKPMRLTEVYALVDMSTLDIKDLSVYTVATTVLPDLEKSI